jgi:Ca-activated chloride channel homolog
MITFESPGLLVLLTLVPTLFYLNHFWHKRGTYVSFSFTIWQKEVLPKARLIERLALFLSTLAFWLGLIALLIAVAGPAVSEKERIHLNRGLDILLILDESPSMAAQDFSPVNRFETAKKVLTEFISRRTSDSIGLVAFGDQAALRVPPTRDYSTLLGRLQDLDIMEMGQGTAIGMGIAVACVHLQHSRAQNKIAILITDGKSNAGEIPPLSAAKIAAEMGVRVYTIGVGTRGEVPIELEDPATGNIIRGKIESEYDEELLEEIAQMTGGKFFPATSPGSLESVFNDIDSLETVQQRVRIDIKTEPIHREFILAGFVLLVLSFFIRKIIFREVL